MSTHTPKAHSSKLITGIPRSGTTLCCHILNQQQNMVALHEPIRPDQFKVSESSINSFVAERCAALKQAIYEGKEFEHGHKGGLDIDNPVGLEQKQGKRQVVAQRGMVTLSKFANVPISLVVKQNAFFTAYLEQLSAGFDVLCIVRNPVDVLLSWWTVNLPVARGMLPAGSNNNAILRTDLHVAQTVLEKQLVIYQWFINQFTASGNKVLKYEDIISSNGKALTDHFNIASPILSPLNQPVREYEESTLQALKRAVKRILELDCSSYYTHSDIELRLSELL